jgi:glucosamine--fructose-6-phosphate aminotransferase (isomerizing)
MAVFPDARGRHPFHMHDMIGSQPTHVEEAIRRVRASDFGLSVARARHLVLTGCGTSFHAAMYGARILQAAARGGAVVEAVHAYDLANRPLPSGRPTILGVSHSGTTPTTNQALARAKRAGHRVLGVCGLPDTKMEEIVRRTLVIGSMHDRSWANTMSYTTQLAAFAALASHQRRDRVDLTRGVSRMPQVIRKTLETERAIGEIARPIARRDKITFLGAGFDEITAFEAALKIRETCGLTASAYHPEQFLHGPFLSVDRNESIVFLRSREDGIRADVIGRVFSKAGAEVTTIGEHPRASIRLPSTHPYLRPIVSVIPMQFLAYYAALARHANPDIMRTDIPRLRAGVAALFH